MTVKVIGVGNLFRRDDGAAFAAIRSLNPRDGIEIITTSAEPTKLMTAWEGAETAIIVDAAAPAGAPGQISRIIVGKGCLPAESPVASTHAFGLAKAIELAETIGERPKTIIVYAIEGENFEHGEGLSPAVEGAISALVQRLTAEIDDLTEKAKDHA